jgi:hypothetical protein
METRKGRRWGATIFGGEEGKEVRRHHGVEGERHNKEQCDSWHLEFKHDQRNWVGRMNARLAQTTDYAREKNMAESMRWDRKMEERILVGQNGKEKRK